MKHFGWFKTKFVVWVWNHTPNCAEMSRLTSRSLEQPQTVMTRLKMRLHFVICAWCRRYFEQIHFLHDAAPRLGLELGELPGRGMSAEAKQRITQRIKAAL
jgi:hypothetical protein